jgi:hypothetical protein
LAFNIDEVRQQISEAEQEDLVILLNMLNDIYAKEKEVIRLDNIVHAGAAAFIKEAIDVVQQFSEQLKERHQALTSGQSFAELPVLPIGAEPKVENALLQSLLQVNSAIASFIQLKGEAYQHAEDQLEILAESGRKSNATTMAGLIDNMQAAGEGMATAEALSSAVDATMQSIYGFLQKFEAYRHSQHQRKAIATEEIDALRLNAAEIQKEIDMSELLELKDLFFSYSIMWIRSSQAREILSNRGASFSDVGDEILSYSVAVHEWLNEETNSLCIRHQGCKEVRKKIVAEVEETVPFCDERHDETMCHQMYSGFAPSGRMCKWIRQTSADLDAGLRHHCKTVMPPTIGLKYHQEDPDGRGIFY